MDTEYLILILPTPFFTYILYPVLTHPIRRICTLDMHYIYHHLDYHCNVLAPVHGIYHINQNDDLQ